MVRHDDALLVDLAATRADAIIDSLDRRIAAQLDAILHHPKFQRLERAWRSLAFLVERTNFRENIEIAFYPCTLDELRVDLVRSGAPARESAFFAVTARGATDRPYGAILADFEFDPTPEDITLLERIAEVGTCSLAPFIAAASPGFFGIEDRRAIGTVDLLAHFAAHHRAFAALRDQASASLLGLTVGRFLLRAPFAVAREATETLGGFTYDETARAEDLAWGLAVVAFATRLTSSFAKYRWCPNIVGRADGLIEDLPRAPEGAISPLDANLGERTEYDLSEEGFIPLSFVDATSAGFFSARSLMKPKRFGNSEEARAAEFNHRLGTELPYVFISTRIGQYLKVVHRSFQINDPEALVPGAPPRRVEKPSWATTAVDDERELNDWAGQYVADREVVPPALRGRRPLRKVQVIVRDSTDGEAWRSFDLRLRPHFKHMGAFFTLSLKGTLDP
ncbi:MAG: type VI secretion system contractile sheath large subunit [Polyangiaceae bacterium]